MITLKRLFDIIVSASAIIVFSPIMAIIAVLIKLESKGPVFYHCLRIGKDWKPFRMLKFRTMVENADNIDCKLCTRFDVRTTPLGKLLRRTKFNELPQFFNVLKGDMGVVGPRPEDPRFMTRYKERWSVVLSVRPGILGPNQIQHRNEEDLLEENSDPERFYEEHILPGKLDRDVGYVQNHTIFRDMGLLLTGLYVTLFRGAILKTFTQDKSALIFLVQDTLLSVAAYLLACYLRYEGLPREDFILPTSSLILGINPVLFLTMGLPKRSPRFFSVPDLIHLLKISAVAGVALIVAHYFLFLGSHHSRAVFVLYPIMLVIFLGGSRLLYRIIVERREKGAFPEAYKKKVLVFGAGRTGCVAARHFQMDPGCEMIGFLDDDPSLRDRIVAGVRVLGSTLDIPSLSALYDIDIVVLANGALQDSRAAEITTLSSQAGIPHVLVWSPQMIRTGGDVTE